MFMVFNASWIWIVLQATFARLARVLGRSLSLFFLFVLLILTVQKAKNVLMESAKNGGGTVLLRRLLSGRLWRQNCIGYVT
jgi:hypothetical protein